MGILTKFRKNRLQKTIGKTGWLRPETLARLENVGLSGLDVVARCVSLVPRDEPAAQNLFQAGLTVLVSPDFNAGKLEVKDWSELRKGLLNQVENQVFQGVVKALDLSGLPGLEWDRSSVCAAITGALANCHSVKAIEEKVLSDLRANPVPCLKNYPAWKKDKLAGVLNRHSPGVGESPFGNRVLNRDRCLLALDRMLESESTLVGREQVFLSLDDRFRNTVEANREYFLQPQPQVTKRALDNLNKLNPEELKKIAELLSTQRSDDDSDQAMVARADIKSIFDIKPLAGCDFSLDRFKSDKDQGMMARVDPKPFDRRW